MQIPRYVSRLGQYFTLFSCWRFRYLATFGIASLPHQRFTRVEFHSELAQHLDACHIKLGEHVANLQSAWSIDE